MFFGTFLAITGVVRRQSDNEKWPYILNIRRQSDNEEWPYITGVVRRQSDNEEWPYITGVVSRQSDNEEWPYILNNSQRFAFWTKGRGSLNFSMRG